MLRAIVVVPQVKGSSLAALDKLPYADGASWNPTQACLPGTRATILSLVREWSRLSDDHRIFCLKGVAGCGKTAISNAVAQALKAAGLLASCFFFDRANASRNTPRLLFSTIARDIASFYPAIAADIAATLEEEPALATAHLSRQFEAFIAGPLRRHQTDRPIVLVIDALDEAVPDDADADLLTILRDEVTQLPTHIRIFITTRPTRVIQQALSDEEHITSYTLAIDSVETQHDIAAYIDFMVRGKTMRSQMGTPWPDQALIDDLKIRAGGHFIWIATVFAYLRSAHHPRRKLHMLLSSSSAHGQVVEHMRKIDDLYASILEVCGDWNDPDFRKGYALFMGSIMAVKRPLSLTAHRALHGGSQELALESLPQRFGSLLVGLQREDEPIHTLHLSFREFITVRAAERTDTQKFFLSEKEHSQKLAELCLRTMVREMTGVPITGGGYLTESSIDMPSIPKLADISEQLLYGCESWSDHGHDMVLTGLYDEASQAEALFVLSWRLKYDGRLEEALKAIEDSVHLRRVLAAQQAGKSKAKRGMPLRNFLSNIGRGKAALHRIRKTIHPHQNVMGERPETVNTTEKLADSLGNLSVSLSDLGRHGDALAAIQEAVGLRRALAAERPAAFNAFLANALNNLSIRLSDHGRHEEALAASQEAVGLRRALAVERPKAFNAALAESLNNLSAELSDHGRHEEALAAIQEAVGLRRALAAERPEAFNADLAESLNNLAIYLSDHGRHAEALAAIQEAVGLRRALAAERPAAFNADLAHSLNSLSAHLSNLGRHEEALAASQEALGMRRALAAERPAAFNADLAESLFNISIDFSGLGRHEKALEAAQEAVNLYRALAAERPKVFTSKLSNALWQLSLCFSASGREAEAKVALEEAQSLGL
ncbi:hypothetical protein HWV62_33609 [Athelia sp. TMB]|nr:hypothetical protein HWV62_33609 [Athelia sp. TMB]